jgi:hypothetical protein
MHTQDVGLRAIVGHASEHGESLQSICKELERQATKGRRDENFRRVGEGLKETPHPSSL